MKTHEKLGKSWQNQPKASKNHEKRDVSAHFLGLQGRAGDLKGREEALRHQADGAGDVQDPTATLLLSPALIIGADAEVVAGAVPPFSRLFEAQEPISQLFYMNLTVFWL